ncbi:MAG: kynureninase, partial [Bacteroidetes bacterium]
MKFENSPAFAKKMDEEDVLKSFRNEFYFPDFTENVLYFTGNSLGLQPKQTKEYIQQELDDWAKWGVEGHFKAKNPWYSYHEWFAEPLSKIVGALPSEVVVMNTLTTNLHLLMVSFYRPSGKRYKILCEAKAFPSDQYALQSQVKFHGYNPEDAIIEVYPREGEYTVRLEDVLQAIEDNADSLALVMMGGVNYYT